MKKILLFTLINVSLLTHSQAQLSSGLVAKYSFNNGNALDEINSNHGTVNGASLTTDRFGNANKAYQFDGIDDHILLGDATEFQMGSNDFCISLWAYYTATQQSTILSKRAGASANYNMYAISVMDDPQFGGASEKIISLLRSSNSNDRAMDAGIQSGAWHHVILFHDYSDSTSLIIDGQTISTSTAAITGFFNIAGEPLVLGFAEEANTNFFNGKIDDIRIYNRLLSNVEIDSLYNEPDPSTLVDLENGLVAKYYFNDGNANDESGNANHGTINSAVTTTDRFGNANHAFEFGQNQTISVNDADTLDNFSSGMAISFWMNSPDISTNTNPLITKFSYCGGGFDAYNIRLNTNGAIWSQIDDESGLDSYQFSSVVLDNSTWHHVVLVWERPNVYYYIDGVLDASATTTSFNSDISNSPNNLMFGHIDPDFCGSTYDYNEKLDDIRIYNRTLNALEIDSLYNEANPAFVSVNENEKANILKVFPNPSNGIITIQTEHSTTIEISDLTGKILFTKTISGNESMDISTLSNGLYLILDNNTHHVIKFIKE